MVAYYWPMLSGTSWATKKEAGFKDNEMLYEPAWLLNTIKKVLAGATHNQHHGSKAARLRRSAYWRDWLGRKLELRWESELVGSELDHEKPLVEVFLARWGATETWSTGSRSITRRNRWGVVPIEPWLTRLDDRGSILWNCVGHAPPRYPSW